ncbi:MAG: ThuA domain-containing protein [Defluviitaleaceae bacterium]|nr:ThuA domain-containing protein [Defluviitaleaceae bacterium]
MSKKINVTVWNEEDGSQEVKGTQPAYPEGIHEAIASFLRQDEQLGTIRTATLGQPYHGLTEEVLNDTDVLIWWGHVFHHLVGDDIVQNVKQRVLQGMGLIVLHSGHAAKIFSALLGTNTHQLRWRENNERERIWLVAPNHPIAAGVGEYIELDQHETYGEFFNIPAPDELISISWFSGGEVFRSGCTFTRGLGKIFYFSPGHETYRIYDNPQIRQVIKNAINWAAPAAYPHVTFDQQKISPEELYHRK